MVVNFTASMAAVTTTPDTAWLSLAPPGEFTRTAIFLKWDSTHLAFKVQQQTFAQTRLAMEMVSRSAYDDQVLTVGAPGNPRSIVVPMFAPVTAPAGTAYDGDTNANYGCLADLVAAWTARVVQVKSFGDDSYWYARWRGRISEQLRFDTVRKLQIVEAPLMEKMG